ncbi:hypothetical protein DLI07_15980 [Vibrio parahaemolyticus]|nr:hypothetical protein [Vibrio parahaemolyticus]EGQ8281196.1 hypothetical protein [Vibrio parahaemolyticus]EGQ8719279.1 hypothetical protein [Vibrio parahaemolyticus]EGQ8812390.1 hypothetical protein [Vibrio parahaemolyticus]EGQ8835768.1 hypothetical protein [Vibrio parahaemolyticus]
MVSSCSSSIEPLVLSRGSTVARCSIDLSFNTLSNSA